MHHQPSQRNTCVVWNAIAGHCSLSGCRIKWITLMTSERGQGAGYKSDYPGENILLGGACAVTFQIHSLLWNLKEPLTPSSCLLSKPICFFIPSCLSKAAVAASVRKAFLMDVGHASLWHPDVFTLFPFPWDVDGGDSRQQMHCGIIGGFLLQGAEYQTHSNLKKK